MKVFIDTNVLLDSLLDGRPCHEDASLILSACEFGKIEGFASYLTFANMAYVLRKEVGKQRLKEIIRKSMKLLQILPMDSEQIEVALEISAPDFEDVLQYACAKAGGCEIFVTNNVKHYQFCHDIEIVSTSDYARRFVENE